MKLVQAQEQVNFRLILATAYFCMYRLGIAAASSVRLQKTWCVAKPSSDKATLIANLNYACSQVDCSVLQRRGACFDPDILISHASIAMNLYYQAMGRNRWNCYFDNSALVVTTDPSESPPSSELIASRDVRIKMALHFSSCRFWQLRVRLKSGPKISYAIQHPS